MKTQVKHNKPSCSEPSMQEYIVTVTTPSGIVHEFRQKAIWPRLASMLVKSAHFPGQPVKAVVTVVTQEATA